MKFTLFAFAFESFALGGMFTTTLLTGGIIPQIIFGPILIVCMVTQW